MARTPRAKPPVVKLDDPQTEEAELPEIVEDDEQEQDQSANGVDHDAATESVEDLKAQLAEERQRRERAETEAASARTRVEQSAEEIDQSNLKVIENAIAKEEGNKREAKAALKAAKESGDYDAEIEAQDKLSQANINIKTLTGGKNELERRVEDKKNAPADPVEAYVQGMAPRAASWIKAHPTLVTDASRRSDLEAAHFSALGKRIVQGSDAYYDFIEKELGLRGDQAPARTDPEPERKEQRQQTQQRAPAAPPSRANTSSVKLPFGVEQLPSGQYRLSPARRDAARTSGLTDAQYLQSLLEIEAERAKQIN